MLKKNPLHSEKQKIASWPPSQETRQYADIQGKSIAPQQIGRDLPAKFRVAELDVQFKKLDPDEKKLELASTFLYTDLPQKFYCEFIKTQLSSHPIHFPHAKENKRETALFYMSQHPAFSLPEGVLHVDQWQSLGWDSKEEYMAWLETSMLFAFSGCMHYCSVERVFDVDIDKNQQDPNMFYFKQTHPGTTKKTNIGTVTGFEFRKYDGKIDAELLSNIKKYYMLSISHKLNMANIANCTDEILIPYGQGVFIPNIPERNEMIAKMFEGMLEALRNYKGLPMTLHLCFPKEWANYLSKVNNPLLKIIPRMGEDAYTIANDINDQGEQGVLEDVSIENHKPRQLKSMLLNAGDDDWKILLDPSKTPGQFADNHDLYMPTSDEYYSLMTTFSYYSIQRLSAAYGNDLVNKIYSSRKPDPLKDEKKKIMGEHKLREKEDEEVKRTNTDEIPKPLLCEFDAPKGNIVIYYRSKQEAEEVFSLVPDEFKTFITLNWRSNEIVINKSAGINSFGVYEAKKGDIGLNCGTAQDRQKIIKLFHLNPFASNALVFLGNEAKDYRDKQDRSNTIYFKREFFGSFHHISSPSRFLQQQTPNDNKDEQQRDVAQDKVEVVEKESRGPQRPLW